MQGFVSLGAVALTRPNVVFLWVDDVGYGDLGFMGNGTVKTPNLDRLATSGTALTAHYVPTPICTPSRAALLTGRFAIRSGMTSGNDNFNTMGLGPGRLPEAEVTVAEALRSAGYSTFMVGKWHLGGPADPRALPTRHGFSSYWGMPHTNVMACRAGHQEYPHANLLIFLAGRSPTNMLFTALALLAATPWAFGVPGRPWRLPALALVLAVVCLTAWSTTHLTLLSQKSACILLANESVVEQPVELKYLTLRVRLRWWWVADE